MPYLLVEATHAVAEFAATYLVHSTLLLLAAWCLSRWRWLASHSLQETIWKAAAVTGVLTAALQTSLAWDDASLFAYALLPATDRGHVADVDRAAPRPEPASNRTPLPSATASTTRSAQSPLDWQRSPSSQAHPAVVEGQRTEVEPSVVSAPLDPSQPLRPPFAATGAKSANMQTPAATWRQSAHVIGTSLGALIMLIGIGGLLLLLLRAARFHRLVRMATPIKAGPLRRDLDRLLRRLNFRGAVALRLSSSLTEPCAYGLFRRTILLPDGIADRLSREEMRALLAHELAHFARRDNWWLWLGQILSTVLIWQPLNAVARRRWRQSAEYLCDAWAIRSGARPLELARCLTQVAEWSLERRSVASGWASTSTGGDLVKRVEQLVNTDARRDPWSHPLAKRGQIAAAMLLGVGFLFAAPRVILQANPERVATVSADELDSEWRELEREFAELERDLLTVDQRLSTRADAGALREYRERLRSQLALIQLRRQLVARTLNKESKE